MNLQLGLLLLVLVLVQIDAEPCTTPGGEQGECVSIDDCPALANSFVNPISGTEEILKRFKCGTFRFRVCCISGWNSTNYGKELSDRRYCGLQHTDDYFSTGNTTSLDEFPWLAALVVKYPSFDNEEIVCHGSLINNRYILTSAYCITSNDYFKISKVLLGKYHTENTTSCVDHEDYGLECTETQEFGVEETIVHPFHDRSFHDNSYYYCDIALIRLNKTISYTDYIRPICLPTQDTKFAEVGEILYTTGWGRETLYSLPPTYKKKIKTILLTSEECQKRFDTATSTHHICTLDLVNNNTAFSCNLDRGAPVMFSYRNQWQIVGIPLARNGCGADYAQLNTRVSPYIEWIKQNIRP